MDILTLTQRMVLKSEMTDTEIAKRNNVSVRWLYNFKKDTQPDYGYRRVMKINKFLNAEIIK